MKSPGKTYSRNQLIFLKLGGSLITRKDQPRTAREKVILRLGKEIAVVRQTLPGLQILLGHGSGSFGHTSGKKYRTRDGVSTPDQWQGFAEVWNDAHQLHSKLLEALTRAGVPAVSFPPSSCITAHQRQIKVWNLQPLQTALAHNLLPVVYGDVVFDTGIGGTILSTEELFRYLALVLEPSRICFAGKDPGVWADYPACTTILDQLSPSDLPKLSDHLQQSAATDVTGGMEKKVKLMLDLIQLRPNIEVFIFSGLEPGNLISALTGEHIGTRLYQTLS